MKNSSLITTNKKVNGRKKVSWNRKYIAEVKYECYIPFRIRCSSYQLQKFTKRFDNDSKQYLREIMKRKNLSRVSATASNNQRGGIVKGKRIQKQDPSRPSHVKPFKNEQQEMTIEKGNKISRRNNKKQGPLVYFWDKKAGIKLPQDPSPTSRVNPFKKQQQAEEQEESCEVTIKMQDPSPTSRVTIKMQEPSPTCRVNPFKKQQQAEEQEESCKVTIKMSKGMNNKKQCTLDYFMCPKADNLGGRR